MHRSLLKTMAISRDSACTKLTFCILCCILSGVLLCYWAGCYVRMIPNGIHKKERM